MENTSGMIIENMSLALGEATEKLKRMQRELQNCRDELCEKCGRYSNAYRGACDDCRYRLNGEWERDFNDA